MLNLGILEIHETLESLQIAFIFGYFGIYGICDILIIWKKHNCAKTIYRRLVPANLKFEVKVNRANSLHCHIHVVSL